MGVEEQKEEREVLDSIYPDEITDVSDTAYRITVALDVIELTQNEEEPPEPPSILFHVSYPPDYPDVAPDLDLSLPPNGVQHPLLDLSEDKSRLLDSLNATIEESMGMAMIFTLVTTLKESAETLIADRQRQAQEVKDIESQKAEEEENRKFHGTAVTRERFLEWRARFRAEMEEREKQEKEDAELDDKKKRIKVEEKKMTGRQLWEGGLAKGDDEEADMDGEDAIAAVEKLKVEA